MLDRTPPPHPSLGESALEDDALVGTALLGRVKILAVIARDAMGKVYLGEQTRTGQRCAVKVLDSRLTARHSGAEFARRFLAEARTAARIVHPNVVTIFEAGETPDGKCFVAMEYLEGRALSELLKHGRIAPHRAVHIARQVCAALQEGHALGVVHRDIKPGNVFLMRRDGDEDAVKVLDFGLTRDSRNDTPDHAAQTDAILGSPRYMAPEQVQGKEVDPRTDIYSLGVTLYAMLAGQPPFTRRTEMATMMAQVADPVPPLAEVAPDLTLPPELESVVTKCLAKNPDRRWASMAELGAALLPFEPGDTPVQDTVPDGPREPEIRSRSSRVGTVFGAAAAALAVGVAVLAGSGADRRSSVTSAAAHARPTPKTASTVVADSGAEPDAEPASSR